MFHFNDKTYQIVHEHKDAWNAEAFRERYSEVLDRYDYIVGDWGYSQLRLKGFFKDTNAKAGKDSTIASLQDYLNEYCNFGCAYFVIERVPGSNRSQAAPSEDGSREVAGVGAGLPASAERPAHGRERTERPEHRDNRHRYDASLHRKNDPSKAGESNQQHAGSDRKEFAGRDAGGHQRAEQGQRRDNQHHSRNEHGGNNRNGGGNRNDGSSGDNRERGGWHKDRRGRGGNGHGHRPDKPFEKKNGEGKPGANNQSANSHRGQGQPKNRTPIG